MLLCCFGGRSWERPRGSAPPATRREQKQTDRTPRTTNARESRKEGGRGSCPACPRPPGRHREPPRGRLSREKPLRERRERGRHGALLPAGGEGGRFPGPPARRRVRPAFPFGVKSNGVRIKMRFSGLRLRGCQSCRSKCSRDPRVMGLCGALWGPWRKGHVCHTPGPKHSEGFGAAPVAAHLPQGRTPHLAEVPPGKAPDFSPKEQVDVSKINFSNQQKDP